MITFRLVGYVDGKEVAYVDLDCRGLREASSEVEHASSHRELATRVVDGLVERVGSVKGQLAVVVHAVLLKASLGRVRGKA